MLPILLAFAYIQQPGAEVTMRVDGIITRVGSVKQGIIDLVLISAVAKTALALKRIKK
jgi:hypothetical protein